MKKKILLAIEIIFGLASLVMLVYNLALISEFIRLSGIENPDAGEGIGKGFTLVFLIIFIPIMTALALIRWIFYTARSVKKRGKGKAFLIQLPFLAVSFTALLVFWLGNLEPVNLLPAIILALIGGLGITFIFSDIDLYLLPFKRGKSPNIDSLKSPDSTDSAE